MSYYSSGRLYIQCADVACCRTMRKGGPKAFTKKYVASGNAAGVILVELEL